MKTAKLVGIIALVLLLPFSITGCKDKPSEACAQYEASEKQLATNIKMYSTTWDQILNQGKIDLINETNFDKNVTLIGGSEKIVGIEDFKDYYSNFTVGFSEIKFTIIDVYGHGDKIVKHWNFKGKHTGEFFDLPATGKSVDIDGVTLVLMKDGKIAQEQDFMDNLNFMQQLGIIPIQ